MTGLWRREVEIAKNAGKAKVYPVAILYAKLNEKDRAFELLNKALESRAHAMAQIKVQPSLDNLRSDPRFQELLKKMNLND